MKVDVEASEANVILGGLEFLKQISVPVILMELKGVQEILAAGKDKPDLFGKKETVQQFLNEMISLGYVGKPVPGINSDKTLDKNSFLSWPYNIFWVKNITT